MRSITALSDAAEIVARRMEPAQREFLEAGASGGGGSGSSVHHCYVQFTRKEGADFLVDGYLMQRDAEGVLELIPDSLVTVRCFAFGGGVGELSWDEVVPMFVPGSVILITDPQPTGDPDGYWHCVFPLIGTCEPG